MTVVRHMHHSHKADAPRAAIILGFINQYGRCAVELFGQLGIFLAEEYRTGQGIRVDQPELFRRQGKAAAIIAQFMRLRQKESKLSFFSLTNGQKTELITAVNARENRLAVFKVVQADQSATLGNMTKKGFG